MDDSTGDIREDIKLPEGDIGKEIQSKHDAGDNFMVTIISAMGDEAAIATKAITKWCGLGENEYMNKDTRTCAKRTAYVFIKI